MSRETERINPCVYKLWSSEDLLYVGSSTTFPRRLGEHHLKPWFKEVVTIEVDWFDTVDEMLRHEIDTLHSFTTVYNKHHKSKFYGACELDGVEIRGCTCGWDTGCPDDETHLENDRRKVEEYIQRARSSS